METPNDNNAVVPIIDGRNPAWQIEQAIRLYRQAQAHIHLLNVQAALPKHVSRFFHSAQLSAFHQENGMRLLEPVARRLDEAGVPCELHVMVGPQAETILHFAREFDCGRIVMEESAESWMSALGLGSISSQLQHLMKVRHFGVPLGGA